MTVFKHRRGKTWRYDFWFRQKRYIGNTRQIAKDDAQLVEREIQLRLRHEAGGIAQFFPGETPRFQDWAEIFIDKKTEQLTRVDHVQHITRALLRFWGTQRPTTPDEDAPRHDLRLGDVLAEPDWILQFDAWMARRGLGNQSKNHYRSMLRRMFDLALQPAYRKATGIAMNPFAGIPTEPTFGRTVALSPDQVRAWLAHASHYVRLAIAVAALAPKLRLANVLALQWTDIEPDPRHTRFNPRIAYYLTVRRHKTAAHIKRPLVTPINQQLLRILKDAWQRAPRQEWVITYHGRPVRSIYGGVRAAAIDADIPYGRDREDGATFHTLRHTAATLLSAVEADPLKLRDAIGHTDLATTLKYRHLKPQHERPSLERLSKTLKIEQVVTAARRRAIRRHGTSTGVASAMPQNRPESVRKGARTRRTKTR